MKILHINTERTWRGGEQQTLYLLGSLIERGLSCHLVCQAGSPLETKALEAGVDVFPIVMRGEVDLPAGLRIRDVGAVAFVGITATTSQAKIICRVRAALSLGDNVVNFQGIAGQTD